MRRGMATLLGGALLAWAGAAAGQAAPDGAASGAAAAAQAAVTRIALPADIVWQTNEDDPPIGSSQAIRGGTLRDSIGQYPLTLRLMGPNSNDAFAGWNRLSTFDFGLVRLHPVSDRFMPWMATHWSVMPDQRTIYFRLDPDARWSDGRPVTARDYVFTLEMMRSEHIVDPFYNSYAERFYASIDAIDDHTLRIVGKRAELAPAVRLRRDLADAGARARARRRLGQAHDQQPQVVPGPYVVGEMVRGESVTLQRVAHWWGDGKRRFRGLYNYDRIQLRVIPTERRWTGCVVASST
jgi:microcin C transport system substrate-binding protein